MKNKYKIIKVIATGGMATIYKAEQISLSRLVIIKKLHPHLASDKEFVKRFEREANILGKLTHKNIVEIIDFYNIKGDYYIVLEYVEGKSLNKLIGEIGALPLELANYIVFEIALGLSTAHKQKILHRDIKPGNIMISKDGTVKISDFGLALSLEGTEITEPGATIGTPAYLPPELLKGERASQKSDIYSLGILFYEIITGKNPFEGENRFETINNILYKKLHPIKLLNNADNNAIIKIISKMTKVDPKARYGNIDLILQDLSHHIRATQKNLAQFLSNPVNIGITIEETKQKNKGIFVFGSLLLLTIILFITVSIEQKRYKNYISKNPLTVIHYHRNYKDTLNNRRDTVVQNNSTKIKKLPLNNNNKMNILSLPVVKKDSYGFIKIVIKPWAKIYIDNIFYGNTPISNPIKLISGNHSLTLKHPNRKEYSTSITIVKDETLYVNIILEKAYGYFKIIVHPWAEIYLDGEKKGVTPIEKPFRFTSGEHLLELKKGKSTLWQKTIIIPVKDTLRETINLE